MVTKKTKDDGSVRRVIALGAVLIIVIIGIWLITLLFRTIANSGIGSLIPSGWFWKIVLIGLGLWFVRKLILKKAPHGASFSESMQYYYGQAEKKFGWIMPILAVAFLGVCLFFFFWSFKLIHW